MMKGIIPKNKSKGTDFCGMNDYYYIIRSDLGCYMQSTLDITILSSHPACQNGDHYFGSGDSYFYIIKGKSYLRVSNLTTYSNGVVYSLHPNCQGGDHYLRAFGKFYIIFQGKGTYRRTTNMNRDSDAVEYPLHPNCRDGLYYWGLPNHYYFLKPWGVEYYKGTNFNKDECTAVYSVYPDILNFLPGGLSLTKGPAFGIWENIKTITNDSNTPVTCQKKIIKSVGYNKDKMTQITHNWKIAMTTSAESKDLLEIIVKCQLSLSTENGGSHVSSENKSWNEAT
ncbi:Glycine cleavage system H protein, mitochondrial [Labeo rohita]|uniref:Glycine cleavage system H protein, mitochondrial n=1 Tax=Labeo rohita TaxID=84645 RepID=A0ABQ8L5E7_LABRO|nr:Glycine cleavage system H protein, mitochondrial [Labeo rohita]